MENEKKYKELVSKIKKAYLYAQTDSMKAVLEDILPELAESKDDRIRKALITYFQRFPYPYGGIESAGTNAKEAIAWLEKQESVEEIVERCKDSWYNEGKIQGMREGLTDDEKYQQGWHDAIEKQGKKPQGKTALEGANEEKVDNSNKVASAWNNGYSNGYIQAIEKACEWLENHNDYIDVKDGNVTYFDMRKCVEDFKNYMNGGEE